VASSKARRWWYLSLRDLRTPEGYAKARQDGLAKCDLIKAVAEQNPDRAALAYSPDDVRRLAAQGKFAVVISLLNAYPLGSDLAQIDEWYKRGVRIFGYVHAGTMTGRTLAGLTKPSATVQKNTAASLILVNRALRA
jgi:microsomal dipeptidase-like Zn-dependent dipeptidase